MARLDEEQAKFRSTRDLYPPATGRPNQFGLPQPGLRTMINEALASEPAQTTTGAQAPALQPGERPTPITETLRPTPITPQQNLGGGGVRGMFAPSELVLPSAAQLSRPNLAQVTQAAPAPPEVATTVPAGTGPDLLQARQFRPGITEVSGGTGSRLFTNRLEGGATPEQATGFYRATTGQNLGITPGSNADILQNLMRRRGELPSQSGLGFGEGADTTRGSQQVNFLQAGGRTVSQPVGGGGFQETRGTNGFGEAQPQPAIAPAPPSDRGDRRLSDAANEAFTALGEARRAKKAASSAGDIANAGETRRERLVRERDLFASRGLPGGERAAAIRSRQIAALDKAEREQAKEDRAERQTQVQEGQLIINAQAAANKIQKDLAEGNKGEKFKFVLGETDLLTGQPKAPSITFGDDVIGLDPVVAQNIDRTAKANFARYRAANPDDTTPANELIERFTKQAFADNLGTNL